MLTIYFATYQLKISKHVERVMRAKHEHNVNVDSSYNKHGKRKIL